MTDADDKPAVKVLYSIGLMNRANRESFSELANELTEAGYPAEVVIRPPSGQFSVTDTLEHIVIAIAAVSGASGAVFSKKFLELAAEDAYKATVGKLFKLKPRNPETEKLAVVITVEIDGKQVKNVLAKGPGDIKDFPTRPDRPHGHIIEEAESGGLIIKRSDGSGEQHWTPPQ